jgi:HNH endonuclease
VKDAKKCYLDAMQKDALHCVWCKKRLSLQNLAIDHLLPFSQTQNNSLWNLVPSCKKCNSSKSDSIPTPETIEKRKDRILASWQLERTDHPEAFEQEIRYDLIGFREAAFVAETPLQYLSKRCDFLIQERGYNSWNKS